MAKSGRPLMPRACLKNHSCNLHIPIYGIFFQRFVVKMWSNQENRVRKQVKNPCEARKIKASQILHKIISTQHLTWLIIGVILQIEQRRGHKEIRR